MEAMVVRPPPPIPANALAAISCGNVFDRPHASEPIRKTADAKRVAAVVTGKVASQFFGVTRELIITKSGSPLRPKISLSRPLLACARETQHWVTNSRACQADQLTKEAGRPSGSEGRKFPAKRFYRRPQSRCRWPRGRSQRWFHRVRSRNYRSTGLTRR